MPKKNTIEVVELTTELDSGTHDIIVTIHWRDPISGIIEKDILGQYSQVKSMWQDIHEELEYWAHVQYKIDLPAIQRVGESSSDTIRYWYRIDCE